MSIVKNIPNQDFNFNHPTQNCITKSVLIRVGLVITGILFIGSALVAHYLGANVITSYITGGVGGILIISTCLVSCIQCLGRDDKSTSDDYVTLGQPIGKRPPDVPRGTLSANNLISKEDPPLLDEKLNFPTRAGSHTVLSPIVGTRVHELQAVKDEMCTCPILRDLEKAIYQKHMIYLIPLDKKDEADAISKPLFLEYISKYSSQGITERNIVCWIDDETQKNAPYINKTHIHDIVNQWNTWKVAIYVMSRVGKANEEFDRYLPPHVVAYHEVMHAEEIPKLKKESYGEAGCELLTTIKTFILLDLVYKRIYNIPEKETVNYEKNILLRGKSIPFGEFANFYRTLEQKHGALYKALISPESISYLS